MEARGLKLQLVLSEAEDITFDRDGTSEISASVTASFSAAIVARLSAGKGSIGLDWR